MLILEILQLAWPFILKVLGVLTSVGLMFFIAMVVDECSEDTIQ